MILTIHFPLFCSHIYNMFKKKRNQYYIPDLGLDASFVAQNAMKSNKEYKNNKS